MESSSLNLRLDFTESSGIASSCHLRLLASGTKTKERIGSAERIGSGESQWVDITRAYRNHHSFWV